MLFCCGKEGKRTKQTYKYDSARFKSRSLVPHWVLMIWMQVTVDRELKATAEMKTLHCLPSFWPLDSLHTHTHTSHHTEPLFFSYPCCPSIFILAVGANLLCGDWNIGLGEPRQLRRQTVILWQTPAHPSPSLHLCDLERCFRTPLLFLLPQLSQRERWCFPQPYYHFKDFPQNQSTWPRIRLVAGGTALSDSKCLWKLRHWEATQYSAAIQPKAGASIPDPTSKLQWGARQGSTVTPWLHSNPGQ